MGESFQQTITPDRMDYNHQQITHQMSYTDPCTIAMQMEETYRKIHNDESLDALIEDIEPNKFDVEGYLNSNYDYWNE